MAKCRTQERLSPSNFYSSAQTIRGGKLLFQFPATCAYYSRAQSIQGGILFKEIRYLFLQSFAGKARSCNFFPNQISKKRAIFIIVLDLINVAFILLGALQSSSCRGKVFFDYHTTFPTQSFHLTSIRIRFRKTINNFEHSWR